ncbi:MAG: hypothetical protein H7210_11445 [Pyrinomonadaceae bacterium]|nr:hypothetical protein [Phycisphaerales bacterium]
MSLSRPKRNFARGVVAASAAVMVCVAGGLAPMPRPQPDPAAQEAGAARSRQDQPRDGLKNRLITKEVLRKRLEKRLSEAKESQQRLEEALKATDAGASIEDLKKIFPEPGSLRAVLDDNDPGEGGSGRFGGRDGDGRMGERRPLTEADREVIREVLQSAAPEMATKLDELMSRDPEAAQKKLNEVFPRMGSMVAMRERDPKIYRLRLADLSLARQSIPLARELLERRQKGEAVDSPESTLATTQLREFIVKQFDNRMLGMGYEIEALQARIEEKQRLLVKMKAEQSVSVDRIMESLIKRADKPGLEKELLGPGRGGPGGSGGDRPPPGGKPDERSGSHDEKG